jgi:hypothetical protein
MRRFQGLALALALSLGVTPGLWAQISTGSIYGTVADQSGAPLPGVTVTLSGANIGARTTTSDATGSFRFLNLDPGTYKVATALTGFSTVDRELKVDSGINVNVSFSMKVSTVQEVVTVTEETPVIDAKKTGTGTTLEQQELADLPNSRDPWAILRQVPGVQVDRLNQAGNQSGQQSGYLGKGATQQSSMWVLDGVVITDATSQGASTSYYDFDAFDQVTITTGGADVRVATGGVGINLVTKRGTNDFHGTARGFFTDHKLQSSNLPDALVGDPRLHGSDNADHQQQIDDYGADVGGPIVKDKLWFFGSYGKQDIRIVKFNQVPDKTLLKNYEGKINWQATGNDMLSVLYFDGVKNKYGRPAPDLGTSLEDPNHPRNQSGAYATGIPGILKGEWNHVFGPSLVANVKYAHIDTGFGLVPIGGAGGQELQNQVTGVSSGSSNTIKSLRTQNEANADLDYFAGHHELKFGFGYRKAATTNSTIPSGNMIRGLISTTGDIAIIQREAKAGYGGSYTDGYVSDTFTNGRLTVNAGVRFDHQTAINSATTAIANPAFPNLLPSLSFNGNPSQKIDWNNFSPRVGISYALDDSQKTIVHGSFAIFTDQLNQSDIVDVNPSGAVGQLFYGWNDLNGDGFVQPNEVDLSRPNLRPPTNFTPVTANTIDPNLQPRRDTEVIAGIDHQLGRDFSVALNYTYRRTVNQYYAPFIGVNNTDWVPCAPSSGNGYTAACFDLGPTNLAAINANNFGYTLTNRPDYSRNYNGVELTALKRLSNKWMARVAVSYNDWTESFNGKAGIQDPNPTLFDSYYANTSGTSDGVTNGQVSGGQIAAYSPASGTPYWIGAKWQVSANTMYQLPADFQVAANLFGRQGYPRPLNETSNNALGEQVLVSEVGVGDVRLPNIWNLDFRLSKNFRLGQSARMIVSADVFNVFNSNTTIRLTDAPDSPAFNHINEIENPRLVRFGVRLTF